MTGWPPSTARPPRSIDAQLFAGHPVTGHEPRQWRGVATVSGPRLPTWEQLEPRLPDDRGHDAPLPGADRLRAAPGQRQQRRPGAALVRRVPGRDRTRGHQRRAGHPPPHRGLQALAGRPARAEQAAASPPRRWRTGSARCGCSSSGSTSGAGTQAPARVPMFPGDLPRQDHPLPKALDDAAAAKLLRAAHNDQRLLVRVTVEVLLRTGLRVGEFTALRADAVVPDRRRTLAARPGRQAPRGPLPAAAPTPGRR